MRHFLLFILALLPLLAEAVDFDEHARRVPLGQVMDVYEDLRGQAHIEDVSTADFDERFRRHAAAVLNGGYSRSVYWIRVDLNYRPSAAGGPQRWLLELGYPPLDSVELYLPDPAGGYRLARRTGDTLPWSSREIGQGNYLFQLELAPHQPQRLYLRVQSQGSIQVPLTLWSPHAYLEEQSGHTYVLGIIYGVLLAMLVYNLFIYLSIRDVSYLYYILYIAAFGLYQISVNGAGLQYLWPDHPWWANVATPLFIGAAGLFGCQFARSFLRTAEHSPWVDRLLLLMMGLCSLVILLALLTDYGVSLRLATIMALLFTLAIFAAGIAAWLRKMRMARYFIIAWSALLIGGQINTLMVLGYLPHMFLTMYASQIGAALEVVLLSMALADRINVLKDERASILEASRAELEQLNSELAESNRLKDEFLSSISHELRTPMMGVMGALELLPSSETPAERQQYLRIATDSSRDMLRLVNNILVLSELRAGKQQPDWAPFSLRELTDALQQRFAPRADGKGLDFSVELDGPLPDLVHGDAEKLEQIIGHLLDNAIKFTRQGSVTLRISQAGPATLQLPLQFEVIDTGIGFGASDDDSLYEQFRQLDASLTRRYGGLGIGLAISQRLAVLLDGQLDHRSRPGHGSRFRLRLTVGLLTHSPLGRDLSSRTVTPGPIA
ncbi:ATP-binding protein [Stutzerimonas stutzeri]|uniref:sensor histidine kinase n=1 Tax=Stutzerimonas sp. S1 TaxID=3030652 RepID=UPI002224F075|nr:hybrid sensor histidine kinase/response regulator [Stutzerimonas sp. S1]MCW3147282.1 ATP-binding protein [Stutzerimonas sp. S1]